MQVRRTVVRGELGDQIRELLLDEIIRWRPWLVHGGSRLPVAQRLYNLACDDEPARPVKGAVLKGEDHELSPPVDGHAHQDLAGVEGLVELVVDERIEVAVRGLHRDLAVDGHVDEPAEPPLPH